MSSPPHLGSSCLFPARSGLPGSSADLSSHAASNHPGRSDECSHPLLPRRCQASPLSGGLATFHCISGPNRVRLRCGLRVRPSKASPVGLLPLALAGLHVERVIYKVNSFQFTRSARLVLALQRNAKDAYLCATHSPTPSNTQGHKFPHDGGWLIFRLTNREAVIAYWCAQFIDNLPCAATGMGQWPRHAPRPMRSRTTRELQKMKNSGNEAKKYLKTKENHIFNAAKSAHFTYIFEQI